MQMVLQIAPSAWMTEAVTITPQMAAAILERNVGNRTVRPQVVQRYAHIMSSGGWMLSPEPVVIANTGRLLNGQHRLMAVIKAGACVQMTLVRGVDEATFKVLDRGTARTSADALGLHRKLAAAATFCARTIVSRSASGSNHPTDDEIAPFAKVLQPHHEALQDACNSARKLCSTAPMQVAAMVRMAGGDDPAFILGSYRNMVLGRVVDMTPSQQNFAGAILSGRMTADKVDPKQLFIRAWDLFDFTKADLSRTLVKSERAIGEAREILMAVMIN